MPSPKTRRRTPGLQLARPERRGSPRRRGRHDRLRRRSRFVNLLNTQRTPAVASAAGATRPATSAAASTAPARCDPRRSRTADDTPAPARATSAGRAAGRDPQQPRSRQRQPINARTAARLRHARAADLDLVARPPHRDHRRDHVADLDPVRSGRHERLCRRRISATFPDGRRHPRPRGPRLGRSERAAVRPRDRHRRDVRERRDSADRRDLLRRRREHLVARGAARRRLTRPLRSCAPSTPAPARTAFPVASATTRSPINGLDACNQRLGAGARARRPTARSTPGSTTSRTPSRRLVGD